MFPAQESKASRPSVAKHLPPYVVAAGERVAKPKKEEVPEFGDLLIGNFASGKSSGKEVP